MMQRLMAKRNLITTSPVQVSRKEKPTPCMILGPTKVLAELETRVNCALYAAIAAKNVRISQKTRKSCKNALRAAHSMQRNEESV